MENRAALVQKSPELFTNLFEADRKRLYAYIFAFVTNAAAADDIFQETSMVLWREFEKFTPGTNFSKWANGIAFNRIREYRRANKKKMIGLSEEVLEALVEVQNQEQEKEKKWQVLQICRAALPDHIQNLYEDFYVKNLKAQEIAEQSGRSIFAIRKSIHKLRKVLFDCVEQKMRGEAS
jgi:RNA polymerase sigma-70 factor (ECF subfamily)